MHEWLAIDIKMDFKGNGTLKKTSGIKAGKQKWCHRNRTKVEFLLISSWVTFGNRLFNHFIQAWIFSTINKEVTPDYVNVPLQTQKFYYSMI